VRNVYISGADSVFVIRLGLLGKAIKRYRPVTEQENWSNAI